MLIGINTFLSEVFASGVMLCGERAGATLRIYHSVVVVALVFSGCLSLHHALCKGCATLAKTESSTC